MEEEKVNSPHIVIKDFNLDKLEDIQEEMSPLGK